VTVEMKLREAISSKACKAADIIIIKEKISCLGLQSAFFREEVHATMRPLENVNIWGLE
jgi:nucleoside-triphosphatase THEP1